MMLDWRVKTPSISGPLQGVGVPLAAFWSIALIVAGIFLPLNILYDGLTSIGISFTTGIVLWVFASARTRQDRDWIAILLERVSCKGRMYLMYLWNKYYYRWPV